MKPSIKTELAKELVAPELQALRGDFPAAPSERTISFQFKGKKVTSFASWDVLALGNRREIVAPMAQSIDRYGWSPSASRMCGGTTLEIRRCEARVAQFFGAESALFFSGKNQCVLSVITTLFSELDLIVAPTLVQSPVADACALVGAEFLAVDEWDSQKLAERSKGRRRVCFFIESISIVNGDLPDFPKLFTVAEALGAWVVVDETAAIGVNGLRGAGSADAFKWNRNLLARVVSFNRAVCLSGAAVSGPSELIEVLAARSRYLRVECGEPPALAFGVLAALDVIEGAVLLREKLIARARLLREQITAQGWVVSGGAESPILSIGTDSSRDAVLLSDALFQRGVLTEALSGKSRGKDGGFLRIIVTARHSEVDFEALLESLAVIRARRGSGVAN